MIEVKAAKIMHDYYCNLWSVRFSLWCVYIPQIELFNAKILLNYHRKVIIKNGSLSDADSINHKLINFDALLIAQYESKIYKEKNSHCVKQKEKRSSKEGKKSRNTILNEVRKKYK